MHPAEPGTDPVRRSGAGGRLLDLGLAVSLGYLAVDAALGGPVATAEDRWCRAPGPAPKWAAWSSRLVEPEAVTLVLLTVAGHRRHTGAPAWPPAARVVGGMVVRAGFARLVRRGRPPRAWWRTDPHGWSFPSRHTTQALLATAALLDEVAPGSSRVRLAGTLAATAAVGAGRVRLGVHWPTDVLGGALTGLLWLRSTGTAGRREG